MLPNFEMLQFANVIFNFESIVSWSLIQFFFQKCDSVIGPILMTTKRLAVMDFAEGYAYSTVALIIPMPESSDNNAAAFSNTGIYIITNRIWKKKKIRRKLVNRFGLRCYFQCPWRLSPFTFPFVRRITIGHFLVEFTVQWI